MNRRVFAACIAVAPLLLGGCTVFHKLGLGHARPVEQASRAAPPAAPTLTATGRTQLDSGNFGLAIEAFQQALGRGEPAAPALNGLAVAYARLGRTDVAEQLFRQAVAADPTNGKYAENLALLEQSRQAAEAPVRTASAAPAPQIDGRLVQVAPREFTIRTLRPDVAAASVATTAPTGFRPIVRIALRPATPAPSPAKPRGGKETLR